MTPIVERIGDRVRIGPLVLSCDQALVVAHRIHDLLTPSFTDPDNTNGEKPCRRGCGLTGTRNPPAFILVSRELRRLSTALRFVLDVGEAVELATALADAVDELRADHDHETG